MPRHRTDRNIHGLAKEIQMGGAVVLQGMACDTISAYTTVKPQIGVQAFYRKVDSIVVSIHEAVIQPATHHYRMTMVNFRGISVNNHIAHAGERPVGRQTENLVRHKFVL